MCVKVQIEKILSRSTQQSTAAATVFLRVIKQTPSLDWIDQENLSDRVCPEVGEQSSARRGQSLEREILESGSIGLLLRYHMVLRVAVRGVDLRRMYTRAVLLAGASVSVGVL